MFRNVRKKAIQADMVKMPFTGYTSQGDSPTILTSGPVGSCRTPTAELSRWRSSQAFAVAEESVLRVRTIPTQDGGSPLTKVVPVRHCSAGTANRTSYSTK